MQAEIRLGTCPALRLRGTQGEQRCGSPEPGDSTDALGEFQVCEACGHEWRVDSPG